MYAATTRTHCETVLRGFYDFDLDRGTVTVLVNPLPLNKYGMPLTTEDPPWQR
ncbi:hypothetical protein AB5J72_00955 [Streptomyces sp. CG1]|uniref:hypothetical protein n=1 Tax=Streptomyces sp. CG1 TaxID=1287523 RepID=UPI0034E1C4C5